MDRHSTRRGQARPGLRRAPAQDPGLRDPALLARAAELLPEHRRFCPHCEHPVGRGRDGRPGPLRGTCTSCRRQVDLGPDLAPGRVLHGRHGGRFTVLGLLARGAGWVHAARDDTTGEAVVVTLRPDGDADTVNVLRGRPHPALVALRDVVVDAAAGPSHRDEPSVHLVLDQLEGVAPEPPLSATRAAEVVLAVAPACAHLHGLGLLHADITPGNILLTPGGPVLVDLGSVRRLDDRARPVWGTDGLLAPEIAPGGAGPSVASDVYGLGRTLDVLLGAPVRRPDSAPRPAGPLDGVVARATASDPRARHTDPLALADDLRATLARSAVGATRTGYPGDLGVAGPDRTGVVHQDVGTWGTPSAPAPTVAGTPAPASPPRGVLPP